MHRAVNSARNTIKMFRVRENSMDYYLLLLLLLRDARTAKRGIAVVSRPSVRL